MNFRYKIMQFLSGRYGFDQLFWALFAVAMVLAFINVFFHWALLQFFVYAIEFLALLRAFSRNHYARSKENQKFLAIFNSFKGKTETVKQRYTDKTHVYRKCPACKATLRLPRKKGKHTVNCPKCSNTFKLRIF